jgi:hypothetical protein
LRVARTRPGVLSPGERLDQLEERIEQLRVLYERYFYGADKVPPVREREAVERLAREMMREPLSSTMLRYRYAQLKQRLTTYQHHWSRVMGQIEAGTYRRLLADSERRQRAAGDVPEPRPDSASHAAPPPPDPPAPPLPAGIDAGQARELFEQFVQAKRAAGEDTRGLTYGGLLQKLARELPKLQEQHGGKIRLEVATVGGKVRLRARAG